MNRYANCITSLKGHRTPVVQYRKTKNVHCKNKYQRQYMEEVRYLYIKGYIKLSSNKGGLIS